ncbi:183_t:CDS:10 [Paraglomus occultum]|uniref:protein-serine/threonine phosphatase n=1 Tax=Paraglomus occultum TaxID=144539 RepID=A0A9N8ZKN2_9GLOM|nr:183_t:CDS:10 [Paraglomus occultum]
MGQTLSEPVREKHSANGGDARLIYAVSEMQGWRISMEDAHTALLRLENKAQKEGYSFFGVYDGHGGPNIAKYSGSNLHKRISHDDAFVRGELRASIMSGFLGLDEDLKTHPDFKNDPSGCTAVVALITPDNHILVGNAGDSRAVISVRGEAQPLSNDHKPHNKDESDRINKAGGFVEFGRVNGNLALSRAIGDFEFKQNAGLDAKEQIVTAHPEVKEFTIDPETEFIVLACDGIWDCLSSQDVVAFIRQEISKNADLTQACENLMDRCLAPGSDLGGVGCDNMTVIIVGFLQGRTEKEWYEWIKERVDAGIGPTLSEEALRPSPSLLFQPFASEEHALDLEILSEELKGADVKGGEDDIASQNEFHIEEDISGKEDISGRETQGDVTKIVRGELKGDDLRGSEGGIAAQKEVVNKNDSSGGGIRGETGGKTGGETGGEIGGKTGGEIGGPARTPFDTEIIAAPVGRKTGGETGGKTELK